MSGITTSDRLLRAGPLVLRWGLAAILLYNGWNQASPMFGAETGESFLADVQGIELSANWSSVLGIGQLAVGGLLFLGLFTRLVSLAVLGGAHAVIFTGGIGERGSGIREQILDGLDRLGIELNREANAAASGREADVSTPDSPVRILVVPTNEELMIARDTLAAAQSAPCPN